MTRAIISYSHQDKRWLTRLRVHLRPFERDLELDVWDDTRITPGSEWLQEIEGALKRADLAVLLVSADFLASRFINQKEVPALLTRARRRQCRILYVVLWPCAFDRTRWLQPLQAMNPRTDPLGRLKKAKAEEYLAKLALLVGETVSRPRGQEIRTSPTTSGRFRGNAKIDALIRNVSLADWDAAERVALDIVTRTDPTGRNKLFESLLKYQNCADEDKRFWGAIQTLESCVTLAPWLMRQEQIRRMARHSNRSVRSSAASICMQLAQHAPDRVPLDIVLKLSVHYEDWYVQAPANAALKALVRSSPAVMQIFYERLGSDSPEERVHSAEQVASIARHEPDLLNLERLRVERARLRQIGDASAANLLSTAISACKGVRPAGKYRYGL